MENKVLYYLQPILRVILFLFYIFLWCIPLALIAQLPLVNFDKGSLPQLLFQELGAIFVVTGGLLMIFKTYSTRNFETVFIKRNALTPFLKGCTLGFLLIGICTSVIYLTGNVQFTATKVNFLGIAGYFLFFILVGIFEEFTFRSFPLVVFAERYLIPLSIVLNGLLFGLVHMANPGFSALAMLNISLCGILFSIITLQKKNIWWAVGIHFGWNFSQGNLFGFKVSGLEQSGLMLATPKGNIILSGGAFGIEGSIICTIILILFMLWFALNTQISPVIEIEECKSLDATEN